MSRQEAVTVIRLDTNAVPGEAKKVEAAFTGMARSGDASAGQIRAAMRSLPAQFTDVATQLAGGQNPLLILLQQGGQVRDQFGSIGAALRGVGSFINPATLGVAAVAALGATLLAAERDGARFRNAIELSGNAAGLTEDRFNQLARTVADGSQTTVSGARDITLALVQAGTVGGGALESVAMAAARVADVSGRSGEDVAKDFARMGSGVADWAAEHNKAWNFITAEQYKYIKQLEEQGKSEEAMIFVSKQLTGQLESQRQNLGTLESAWSSLGKTASEAWQAMLNVGKSATLGDQLAAAQTALAKTQTAVAGDRFYDADGRQVAGRAAAAESLKERIESIKEMQRLEQRGADAASARASTARTEIETVRNAEKKGAGRSAAAGDKYRPQFDRLMNSQIAESQQLFESEDARAIEYLRRLNESRQSEAAKQVAEQAKFFQELVDANAKTNLDLIADDQARALAQIDIERAMMQRRIEIITDSGPERQAAEALADQQAQSQRQSVGLRFAKDTALVTREETRNALAEAFQDTKNPIRAFGDALGNIVFQRVSTRLADALLTAAIGSGPDGISGGFLGSLFSAGTSLLSGGVGDYNNLAALSGARASGGPVDAGGAYLVGERGPEILQMGSQAGRIIPNAGRAGGGVTITLSPVIQIDARTDQAQVAQLVAAGMQQTQRDMWAQLHARGLA